MKYYAVAKDGVTDMRLGDPKIALAVVALRPGQRWRAKKAPDDGWWISRSSGLSVKVSDFVMRRLFDVHEVEEAEKCTR